MDKMLQDQARDAMAKFGYKMAKEATNGASKAIESRYWLQYWLVTLLLTVMIVKYMLDIGAHLKA